MRTTTLFFSFALMVSASLPAGAQEFRFTGRAMIADGSVVYEEHHAVNGTCKEGIFRPQDHRVDYHEPGAEERFAQKLLDYRASALRPSVNFVQPLFDEAMEITYPEAGTLDIHWQTPRDDSERFQVRYSSDTVVDSGFDNLVRQNWQSVVAGQSVDFRFLGPTRGDHYGFVLESVESDLLDADHKVQIRPTGIVLRFLVNPIVLGYNDAGALTDYIGLTNIRKNQNENYTAHIRYLVDAYPDCELIP